MEWIFKRCWLIGISVGCFGYCDTREWRRTQRQPLAGFRQDCRNRRQEDIVGDERPRHQQDISTDLSAGNVKSKSVYSRYVLYERLILIDWHLSKFTQVKMTVYRAEPPDLKEMDVEITKKSGKDIGLSFAECKENGIYVLDIVSHTMR